VKLSILGARVIDPASGLDQVTDLHLDAGKIVAIGAAPAGFNAGQSIAAKGLVAIRPRTGTHVLPRAEWNLFDPAVLGWQSEAPPDKKLIADLMELRQTIEPLAARLAWSTSGSRCASPATAARAASPAKPRPRQPVA